MPAIAGLGGMPMGNPIVASPAPAMPMPRSMSPGAARIPGGPNPGPIPHPNTMQNMRTAAAVMSPEDMDTDTFLSELSKRVMSGSIQIHQLAAVLRMLQMFSEPGELMAGSPGPGMPTGMGGHMPGGPQAMQSLLGGG